MLPYYLYEREREKRKKEMVATENMMGYITFIYRRNNICITLLQRQIVIDEQKKKVDIFKLEILSTYHL